MKDSLWSWDFRFWVGRDSKKNTQTVVWKISHGENNMSFTIHPTNDILSRTSHSDFRWPSTSCCIDGETSPVHHPDSIHSHLLEFQFSFSLTLPTTSRFAVEPSAKFLICHKCQQSIPNDYDIMRQPQDDSSFNIVVIRLLPHTRLISSENRWKSPLCRMNDGSRWKLRHK